MGDESLVSASALAAYDAAAAGTFGRTVAESTPEPLPWRTGPVGQLTVEEYDDKAGLTFGRFVGDEESAARRRVAEADRQIAKERQVLERAQRLGWETALMATPIADRVLAESVRARVGATRTGTGTPSRSVRESSPAGGGRTELREVIGWKPKPWQPKGDR